MTVLNGDLGKVTSLSFDDDVSLSSLGESEIAVLNPLFLSKQKCLTWLEQRSLSGEMFT